MGADKRLRVRVAARGISRRAAATCPRPEDGGSPLCRRPFTLPESNGVGERYASARQAQGR
eukprot:2892009-Prymnesium_polylepis.1